MQKKLHLISQVIFVILISSVVDPHRVDADLHKKNGSGPNPALSE